MPPLVASDTEDTPVVPAGPVALSLSAACWEGVNWYKDQLHRSYETSTFVGAVVGAVRGSETAGYALAGERALGLGPPGIDTLFMIGSLTKVFTATLLALDAARGKVQIETGASMPLTKVQDQIAKIAGNRVIPPPRSAMTVLDLATHCSGLVKKAPDDALPKSVAELYDLLVSDTPVYAPGDYWYSNIGFAILGHLLADRFHSGSSWHEAVKSEITKKLDMADTGVDDQFSKTGERWLKRALGYDTVTPAGFDPAKRGGKDPQPFVYAKQDALSEPYKRWEPFPVGNPAGALWSTAADMTTWLKYNLGLVTSADASKLNAVLAALHKPRRDLQRVDGTVHGNVGLGWSLSPLQGDAGGPMVCSKGGDTPGHHAWIGFISELKCGVFVLANCKIEPSSIGKRVLGSIAAK